MLDQPGVLEGLLSRHASLRTRDELLNEVLRLPINVTPLIVVKVELSFGDHGKNLVIVGPVKGRVAAEQDVKKAPGRPHVTRDVVIAGQDLWRDVVGRSCSSVHPLQAASITDLRQAEVDNLQVRVLFFGLEQEVLGLEVPMHDVLLVTVVQRLQDLLENACGDLLTEEFFGNDAVEEFTARAESIVSRRSEIVS